MTCILASAVRGEKSFQLKITARNRQSNFDDITIITETFTVIPVYDSFERLARIRLDLKNKGKMIDAYDMMIGATAVHHGFILVTHNTKHYVNIPDIVLEDWQ